MKKVKQILLIEDDTISNYVHERILQRERIADSIIIKKSAEEALEFLKHENLKGRLCAELIFLDIRLPVMNGDEFLEEFKKLSFENMSRVNIVIVSTSNHPDDLRKFQEAGIKHYIVKPLTTEKLQELLKNISNLYVKEPELSLLFNNKYLAIYYNYEEDFLFVDWTGPQTKSSIIEGCEKILLEVIKKNCSKILNNNKKVVGPWDEVISWGIENWFPRLKNAGLKYFAWVASEDDESNSSMNKVLESSPFLFAFSFKDIETAQRWLKVVG